MGLSVGIAGLPNVGKSTLLNALTHAGAEASNYPFCTIDRNLGTAQVPDPDLDRLKRLLSPKEALPATVAFVDIAGLVAGASKGEGLGNKFLGHIREADAILHVVRCFEDANVVHASGSPDPVRDVSIVETEFLLADLDLASRARSKLAQAAKSGKAADKEREAAMEKLVEGLREGIPVSRIRLHDREPELLAEHRFLTAKPCLYLANTGEDDPGGQGALPRALKEAKGADCVLALSVRIEEEISLLSGEEEAQFRKELGLPVTALEQVVAACYRLLDLITFYTIANDKLRGWPIRRGSTAAEAAGKVHSDMEHGFIRAEVMSLENLTRYGSRHALHEHGLVHTVARDHPVEDKDVLQFHFKV